MNDILVVHFEGLYDFLTFLRLLMACLDGLLWICKTTSKRQLWTLIIGVKKCPEALPLPGNIYKNCSQSYFFHLARSVSHFSLYHWRQSIHKATCKSFWQARNILALTLMIRKAVNVAIKHRWSTLSNLMYW